MAVKTLEVNNGIVALDDHYNHRWLDAFGDNVTKHILSPGVACDDTTGDPTQYTMTVTEAGVGGDSTVVNDTTLGSSLLFTTDNAEYDGINLQLKGSAFKLELHKPLYFGCKAKISDATQTDMLIGLAIVKTDLMATAASHAVSANVEGVFFYKLDAATTVKAALHLNGVSKIDTAWGTALDTNWHVYEFYWDGVGTLSYYIDDQLVTADSAVLANLPDSNLTVSYNFRAGSANARTMNVAWTRCFYMGA
jgi:hypothetical protein